MKKLIYVLLVLLVIVSGFYIYRSRSKDPVADNTPVSTETDNQSDSSDPNKPVDPDDVDTMDVEDEYKADTGEGETGVIE